MKIDKAKFVANREQRILNGRDKVPPESVMRKFVFNTQEKYKVTFDVNGVTEFYWFWIAARLFMALPEAMRKVIKQISMNKKDADSPLAPLIACEEALNPMAQYIVELEYENMARRENEGTPIEVSKPMFIVWDKAVDDDDDELKAFKDYGAKDAVMASNPKLMKQLQHSIKSHRARKPKLKGSKHITVNGDDYWVTDKYMIGQEIKNLDLKVVEDESNDNEDSWHQLYSMIPNCSPTKVTPIEDHENVELFDEQAFITRIIPIRGT